MEPGTLYGAIAQLKKNKDVSKRFQREKGAARSG